MTITSVTTHRFECESRYPSYDTIRTFKKKFDIAQLSPLNIDFEKVDVENGNIRVLGNFKMKFEDGRELDGKGFWYELCEIPLEIEADTVIRLCHEASFDAEKLRAHCPSGGYTIEFKWVEEVSSTVVYNAEEETE